MSIALEINAPSCSGYGRAGEAGFDGRLLA